MADLAKKCAAVFVAVAAIAAGAAPSAWAQGEPRTVQHQVEAAPAVADPLCLLLVANDLYTRAARAALAETKDPELAVALYRSRMAGLVERSPIRVLRDKLGTDPTPEQAIRVVEEASRACPAWAKKKAADPKVRAVMLRHLAGVAARGRPMLFAMAYYNGREERDERVDTGGHNAPRESSKGTRDWDILVPNPQLIGAVLVGVGTLIVNGAAAAGRAGVPQSTVKVYEGFGQVAIAVGSMMVGLDIAFRGGAGRP